MNKVVLPESLGIPQAELYAELAIRTAGKCSSIKVGIRKSRNWQGETFEASAASSSAPKVFDLWTPAGEPA